MENVPPLMIVILAAGSASRMRGVDKLLQPVDTIPQLRRVALAALQCDALVAVTLPPDRPLRTAALAGLDVPQIMVTDADEGMAASIRAGARACRTGCALMVLPADMPELGTAELSALIAAWRGDQTSIWRAAAADGRLGHPVIFPADLRGDLMQLQGDSGARTVLKTHQNRVRALPLLGERALRDLDTPEEWAAWYAAR